MSFFDTLEIDESIEVEEQEVRKVSSWIKDSGAYVVEIKMFRFGQSDSGAGFYEITMETETGAKIVEKEYFSSKAGLTTYPVKDRATGKPTGELKDLPGMAKLKARSRSLTGDATAFKKTSEKIIAIYDFNKKADIDTKVEVFTEAIGKNIEILVEKTLYDKTKRNPATGEYEPVAEVTARTEIVAWVDPVTHKTYMEEQLNKEPDSYTTFMDNISANPVRDKRKVSKGVDTTKPEKEAAPTEAAKNAFA